MTIRFVESDKKSILSKAFNNINTAFYKDTMDSKGRVSFKSKIKKS